MNETEPKLSQVKQAEEPTASAELSQQPIAPVAEGGAPEAKARRTRAPRKRSVKRAADVGANGGQGEAPGDRPEQPLGESPVQEKPAPRKRRKPVAKPAIAADADADERQVSGMPAAGNVPDPTEEAHAPRPALPESASPAADESRPEVPAQEGAGERDSGERRRERRGRGLRANIGRGKRGQERDRQDGGVPRGRSGTNVRFEDVVSGRYDEGAAGGSDQSAPAKRVLAPEPESPKLHKVLAQAGLGSRLEMEQLILEGRISVNGEPAHIGQRIQYGDQVRVNGKPIRVRIAPPLPRVLAYHKPAGEVVTHDDPQSRPTVFARLPRLPHGKWQSVGRLDLNTEGLLLLTNSGELANSLMHPRFGVEREYAVRVLGGLSADEKQRLLDGIDLDDGRAQFKSIEEGGGDGANQWYRVVIIEGRNREVRRMMEALGHAVSRLIRIRYGVAVLPAGLRRGQWMELPEADVNALGRLSGAKLAGGGRNANGPGAAAGGGNRQGQGGQQKRRNGDRQHGGRGNDVPKNQPDPMKTSFGYLVHETFTPLGATQPPGGGRRQRNRGGAGGGGAFGTSGFAGRDDFNRGRGNRKRGGGNNGNGGRNR